MDNRIITVVADARAIPVPLLTIVVSTPMNNGDLNHRQTIWNDGTAELLAPLSNRRPVPAAIAVENLTKVISETDSEIKKCQAQLAGNSIRLASAAAADKDLAGIEAEASTASARLASLQVRLPALQSHLRDAKTAKQKEEALDDAEARIRLRNSVQAELEKLTAKLLPAGVFEPGGQLDRLAVLQQALAHLSR